MAITRKSTRVITPTTKAKQSLETSTKKQILRSISTIDEDENTYNNINFKKRRIEEDLKQNDIKEEIKPSFNYNLNVDNDSEIDDEVFGNTDEENIFNSDEEDDDEYASAISDYESDSFLIKPTFRTYYSKSFIQKKTTRSESIHQSLNLNENLFNEDDENNNKSSSPITSSFNFNDNSNELIKLEENFQKIIDENQKIQSNCSNSNDKISLKETNEKITSINSTDLNDIFVDYLSEEISSSDESESDNLKTNNNNHNFTKQKFLQYRHDEKHNLALTFPIRFDPTLNMNSNNKNKKSNGVIRALKRRAIQTGKASEMIGMTDPTEFNFF